MTVVQQIALSAHVILGLIGVMAAYGCWMHLLGRYHNPGWVRATTIVSSLSYWLAWLCGGYYYLTYYGTVVKPIIKAGSLPWAHTIVMESKEHIFLFLPFLSILLLTMAYSAQPPYQPAVLRSLRWLAGLTATLGGVMAIAGFIISGSVH